MRDLALEKCCGKVGKGARGCQEGGLILTIPSIVGAEPSWVKEMAQEASPCHSVLLGHPCLLRQRDPVL